MRHYNAKQRNADKRWDYACDNHPVGYCAGYHEFTEKDTFFSEEMRNQENAKMARYKEKYHADGHNTEEEARLCYKEYLLDNTLRLYPEPYDPDQLNKCKICQDWTAGFAVVEDQYFNLCKHHCNRESVAKLMGTPGQTWAS